MKYKVLMMTTVSTTVEVEAEDREDAIEKAYEKGVPGLMFLDHTYPDEGEWYFAQEGRDADGDIEDYVWEVGGVDGK